MILPWEMLVEHAPDSAPRAKKLVEHWLRRRHGSRAPAIYSLIHDSLNPLDTASQTACRSVKPFVHSSQQSVYILYNRPPLAPQNCPYENGASGNWAII